MDIEKVLDEYEQQGYLRKRTIHEEFKSAAQKYPDKTAITDAEGSVTYRQLDAWSDRLADFFLENGLRMGDSVLLQLPNINLYVAVLLALLKAGIVPALLLPTHRTQEIVSVAKTILPKAYIGCREFLGVEYAGMVQESEETKNLTIQTVFTDKPLEGGGNYPCRILPGMPEPSEVKPFTELQKDYRATALYLLSGGTTNLPKVIPRIHECYAYNSLAAAKAAGITKDSVYMAVLSASHDYPLASPGVLGLLYNGGSVVLCATAAFDEAFEMIEKHRVTFTCIVPAIAQVWAEVLDWYEGDFSTLKNIVVGAAKLERETAEILIKRMGIILQQAYGLGEGITCYTALTDPLEVTFTCQGKPVSEGDSVKIVDPDGNELPAGEAGELLEKGPYTFFGYYGNEKLNEGLFTEDGYLKTGDKAYRDELGNIVICGRVREQINRAGENVSPQEVESLLRKHPDVRDAAVFGRPDASLGEKTTAVIVTQRRDLTLNEIAVFFRTLGIAQYKIPDEIFIRDKLVYTNVGKTDKKLLKRMIEESEGK